MVTTLVAKKETDALASLKMAKRIKLEDLASLPPLDISQSPREIAEQPVTVLEFPQRPVPAVLTLPEFRTSTLNIVLLTVLLHTNNGRSVIIPLQKPATVVGSPESISHDQEPLPTNTSPERRLPHGREQVSNVLHQLGKLRSASPQGEDPSELLKEPKRLEYLKALDDVSNALNGHIPGVSLEELEAAEVYPPQQPNVVFEEGGQDLERHATLLVEALQNPNHPLRPAAEQAVRGFRLTVEKPQLTSLTKASQDYGIPLKSLSRHVASGLIPYAYRDLTTIYLAQATAHKVARAYERARHTGEQPVRLLRQLFANPPQQAPQEAERKVKKPHGVAFERQRAQHKKAKDQRSAQAYEIVATLKQASAKTGLPMDQIVTISDIASEWNINRVRIHDWTRRGPHGKPHLTPLPVRLSGGRGSGQLLFRRQDIEQLAANPPKPGPPRK